MKEQKNRTPGSYVISEDSLAMWAGVGALIGAVLGIFILPHTPLIVAWAIVLYAFQAFCVQQIAQETSTRDGWMAWIPIANIYLLCRITKTDGVWTVLCLIPFIGAIFGLILLWRLTVRLGVTGSSRVLILIPGVSLIYIGYLALFRVNDTRPQTAA